MAFINRNKIVFLVLALLTSSFSYALVQYLNNDKPKTVNQLNLSNSQDEMVYVCPMHPHIVSHEADNCPICGMDLVVSNSTQATNDKHMQQDKHSEVRISSSVRHNLGIKTAIVGRGDLTHDIETIGKITRVDPMARSRITSPISGKLIEVTDKYQGDEVKRDDFLFSVSSQKLFDMEKEYQQAVNNGEQNSATTLITKLVKMGLSTEQIAQLHDGAPATFPAKIFAREDGFIFTRRGRKGDAVTSAFTVFNLGGNYQVIEVTVEIFERQWDLVKEGQSATMQLRNLPGKTFQGIVERVDDPVGYTTRALETRIKYKTDIKGLTQSTFARVIIQGKTIHNVITVPRDAVIQTAQGNRIVKLKENGSFQPVAVEIGDESNGKIEIKSGIKEGDKIVVSGQFLIDSESNIISALNRMSSDNESK